MTGSQLIKRIDNSISELQELKASVLKLTSNKRITQRQAQMKYGRNKLEMWRMNGQVKRYQVGSRFEYDLDELEKANMNPQTIRMKL